MHKKNITVSEYEEFFLEEKILFHSFHSLPTYFSFTFVKTDNK